jgi:PIN domain nuclease of toxin-antitoxin system
LARPLDGRQVVLDATAILAVLFNEPGSEQVLPVLQNAAVSAVNLAELYAQLLRRGVKPDLAWKSLQDLGLEVCPFDAEQARVAGELAEPSRDSHLSFGDRACLALGVQRKAAVYTTNAAWKRLELGVEMEVIR